MLQLLQSLWLFALTGISVPVIIHFWNQRPGKTLKVGSTALVVENAKEYRRSVKLSDILLLILRCLLIAALALALSEPIWKQPIDASKQKGWILIPRKNLNETYTHFKNTVDSLQKAGLEFHYFEKGFPDEKLETALSKSSDTSNTKKYSYWTLLTLLDEALPSGISVYLFTDNYLTHFSGNRPALFLPLKWLTYTPADSIAKKKIVNTDTAALNITVFTDKYPNDTRYIKAAIDAIKSFTKRNINCTITTVHNDIKPGTDWIFWLSDESPVSGLHGKNILAYQKGMQKNVSSVINMEKIFPSPLKLYKAITVDSFRHAFENKWTDGFGNPVLSEERRDSVNYYKLYTHFDPSWNELVWDHNFPAIIYGLIVNDNTNIIADSNDYRTIDQHQLLPDSISHSVKNQHPNTFSEINLTGFSWLLVLLLFLAERFVSFQNTKLKTNG